MTVCLTCKRRNECEHKWKYNEFMVGCTGYIESRTNFERVTESPEALAKWVCEITDFCDRGCSHCPIEEKCLYDSDGAGNKDNESLLLDWFNEESKE